MDLRLHGIVPPVVTPLTARDAIDVPGLERLIDHLVGGGVHGLFVLGSTGEGPSLSYAVRRELIDRACRIVSGRVPVLVGITDTSTTESLSLASHAAESGADAVVAAPPYYFPLDAPEVLEYFLELNAALPLPLVLYNMPGMTKVKMQIDSVRRLMEEPNILGIKDSSCDMMYYQKLLRIAEQRDGWFTMVGPEEFLYESIAQGGQGGVPGGSNLAPRLFVQAYEATVEHRHEEALRLQKLILQLGEAIYTVGRHGSAIIKGIKCALSVMGICDDEMASPLHRFQPAERRLVEERIRQLEVSGLPFQAGVSTD